MKKGAFILIGVTAAFICILIGFFIGRNTRLPYRVSGNYSASATEESREIGNGKININTATAEELQLIPGIGEGLSKNIIDYREVNGSFANVEDLLNVPGIGNSRLAQIIDYVKTDD